MRTIYVLTLLLVLPFFCRGQNFVLPDSAFDYMIVKDITYAIVGESTPVSGVKVDVSKPEATLSAVYPIKSKKWYVPHLWGLELKAGATGQNFSFLKGNGTFNTAFEARGSLHFIPAWSGAKFGFDPEARAKKLMVNAKNATVIATKAALRDSLRASQLIRDHYLASVRNIRTSRGTSPASASVKKIMIYYLKQIFKKDSLTVTLTDGTKKTITDQDEVSTILLSLPMALTWDERITGTYYEEVETQFQKNQKRSKIINTEILDKMITNANEAWTLKYYQWFTVSPFVRTEKVNEYYPQFEGRDSLHFRADYRLYYGVTFYYNLYGVWPECRAILVRVGASASQANNLTSLMPYTYETMTPFFSNGAGVTQKTKFGTAYNHADIKTGLASQGILEIYALPLTAKFFIPGVYAAGNVNFSNLYRLEKIAGRQNDKKQFALEGGLVFNVSNREKGKEKSILSLLAYVRHEDITDRRRTSLETLVTEPRDDFRKRNVSFGLRVGIPITLPERSE